MFGVLRAKQGHPKVNFRYIVGPSQKISSRTVPIDYTLNQTEYLIDLGIKDAYNAVKMGRTYSVEENIIHFNPNRTIQYANATIGANETDVYNVTEID